MESLESVENRSASTSTLKRVGFFQQASKIFSQFLPVGWRLGSACDDGDCFYDAISQAWSAAQPDAKAFTVKTLRLECANYLRRLDKESLKPNWVEQAIVQDNGMDDYFTHLATIEFTQGEMNELKNQMIFSGYAIWGKPHVEGRMLAAVLGDISLHIIELHEINNNFVEVHNLVTSAGVKQVAPETISYNDKTMLHLAVYRNHFVPILPATLVSQSYTSATLTLKENIKATNAVQHEAQCKNFKTANTKQEIDDVIDSSMTVFPAKPDIKLSVQQKINELQQITTQDSVASTLSYDDWRQHKFDDYMRVKRELLIMVMESLGYVTKPAWENIEQAQGQAVFFPKEYLFNNKQVRLHHGIIINYLGEEYLFSVAWPDEFEGVNEFIALISADSQDVFLNENRLGQVYHFAISVKFSSQRLLENETRQQHENKPDTAKVGANIIQSKTLVVSASEEPAVNDSPVKNHQSLKPVPASINTSTVAKPAHVNSITTNKIAVVHAEIEPEGDILKRSGLIELPRDNPHEAQFNKSTQRYSVAINAQESLLPILTKHEVGVLKKRWFEELAHCREKTEYNYFCNDSSRKMVIDGNRLVFTDSSPFPFEIKGVHQVAQQLFRYEQNLKVDINYSLSKTSYLGVYSKKNTLKITFTPETSQAILAHVFNKHQEYYTRLELLKVADGRSAAVNFINNRHKEKYFNNLIDFILYNDNQIEKEFLLAMQMLCAKEQCGKNILAKYYVNSKNNCKLRFEDSPTRLITVLEKLFNAQFKFCQVEIQYQIEFINARDIVENEKVADLFEQILQDGPDKILAEINAGTFQPIDLMVDENGELKATQSCDISLAAACSRHGLLPEPKKLNITSTQTAQQKEELDETIFIARGGF
ncbi:MAG: hypothetical protein Tsb005_16960 [Gammaproteobacteria bacterium]